MIKITSFSVEKRTFYVSKVLVDSLQTEMGKNYIALPNTLYGTWEGTLYNFDHGLTDAQKDSARKANLVPAQL